MKNLQLSIFILSLLLISCKKEKETTNFDISNLQDLILEIENRELYFNNEISVFNFYSYAIRFNSDGSWENFDDNYGQSNYWSSFAKTLDTGTRKWVKNEQYIEIQEFNEKPTIIQWEIKMINDTSLILIENKDDEVKEFKLYISAKQNEK